MRTRIKTNSLYKLYLSIISSIAFIPTLISVALFFLAILTIYLDQGTPESFIGVGYSVSIKNIINPDSARGLLITIAGGMISLIVFSFSMLMVVLNQTASNYTPRVLPALIGRKSHQVIMGFYLGTIAYTFTVLTSIESRAYFFAVPTLSIIISALLSLVCLALFIKFIQSISSQIQIGNIISQIYEDASSKLKEEIKDEDYIMASELPQINQWMVVKSPVAGYFNSVNSRTLLKRLKHMNITIKMLVPLGSYVNQKDPFFQVSRPLTDSEQEKVFQTLIFRHQEIIKQNYLYGFKQLTEIAVKAMSPGINDPGTAIQAIDRITDLFVISMKLRGFPVLRDNNEKVRFIFQPISMEDIFYFSFTSIKNYTGDDIPVIHKLLLMIKTMIQNDEHNQWSKIWVLSLHSALEKFMPKISSTADQKRVIKLAEEILASVPAHLKATNTSVNLDKWR